METQTQQQSSTALPEFIRQTGLYEYEMFVDNHMLECYSTCPRKFYYQHILCMRPKGGMPFYPAYGIWFHDVMEQFYLHLEEGFSVEQLFVMAAKQWYDADMQRYALSHTKQYEKMEGSYGRMVVGGRFEVPVSALTLIKQYYDTYYALDRSQWRVLAVENGFGHEREVALGKCRLNGEVFTEYKQYKDINFFYTGRPDLVAADRDGRVFPVDDKTTAGIQYDSDNRFKPHTETAGYIYSIQQITGKTVDRCVINICAREIPAEPRDKSKEPRPRFKRVHPFYSPDELEEWRAGALGKCVEIARLALSVKGWWPMRETQCFLFNQPCDYHDVDKVTPGSRETVLRANYSLSDPWTPYKPVKGEKES